jgi:hypothetical protein
VQFFHFQQVGALDFGRLIDNYEVVVAFYGDHASRVLDDYLYYAKTSPEEAQTAQSRIRLFPSPSKSLTFILVCLYF